MRSSHERRGQSKVCTLKIGAERRVHRRVEMEPSGIRVHRWEGSTDGARPFGTLVDMSAGGVRIRTGEPSLKPETQIRVRLELPDYAGISPFVETAGESLKPKREWVGWMTVRRVIALEGGDVEVAGPLMDMEDVDRGMLGLYLSTQPMAA